MKLLNHIYSFGTVVMMILLLVGCSKFPKSNEILDENEIPDSVPDVASEKVEEDSPKPKYSQLTYSLLELNEIHPIKDYLYLDFDNDGEKEAFALTTDGTLHFFPNKENLSEKIEVEKSIASPLRILTVEDGTLLLRCSKEPYGSSWTTFLFKVEDGLPVCTINGSLSSYDIDRNILPIYQGQFLRQGGHLYIPYWFHWDRELKTFIEDGGIPMSLEALKRFDVPAQKIQNLQKAGHEIGDIFYRQNGLITVNVSLDIYPNEEHPTYLTYRYEDGTMKAVGDEYYLKDFPGGGTYYATFFPDEPEKASYPDALPPELQ